MIVESGLDVPNANTMFVNRADHFGLAQLYQLRGRVGRSHRRAYCYLLVPDSDRRRRRAPAAGARAPHRARRRAIEIALKDLELRGAGNLLGPEQSGFVHAVGFDMYLRMLDETVQRLMRGDDAPKLAAVGRLARHARLPARRLHRRRRTPSSTSTAGSRASTTPAEIEALRDELRDRFGPLPPPAEAFFAMALLRVVGGALGIEGDPGARGRSPYYLSRHAVPRMKGLSAAFHEVQFQAEVRRAHPLSLKLTRLGGAPMLDGLVRALRAVV